MVKLLALPFEQILLEALEEMIFIVKVGEGASFTYSFINKSAFSKCGLNSDAVGCTFHEVHDEKTAHLLQGQYTKVLETGQEVVFEDEYTLLNGKKVFSQTRLYPLSDEEGQFEFVVGIVKDFSEKKIAQLESQENLLLMKESVARYRSLFENNSDAIVTLDLHGNVLTGNRTFEILSGLSPQEMAGHSIFNYFDPMYVAEIQENFQRASNNILTEERALFLQKCGEKIGVLVKFVPIYFQDKITGMYVGLKDMSDFDQMFDMYKDSEEKFRIITENAHEIIAFIDKAGIATYVSPSIKEAGAFSPKIYTGKPFAEHLYPDDVPALQAAFLQAIEKAVKFTLQIRVLNSLNDWLWIELNGTPVFNHKRQFNRMMTISRDITLQKEYEEKLEYFAFHDSLSGLPNRRHFKNFLTQKLKQQQAQSPLAVVLLDIDFFKQINDQFGHEIGDAVIEEFAKRIKSGIGPADMAARLGGDEFVLLLTTESEEHLLEIIRGIQEAIKQPWQIEGVELKVSSSMGVARLSSASTPEISMILKTADDAMYNAKKAGRNRFFIQTM